MNQRARKQMIETKESEGRSLPMMSLALSDALNLFGFITFEVFA